jgi:hypothetical protein
LAVNPYFTQGFQGEQDLYENLLIEAIKMYGQDLYYLPREIVNEDMILGDDVLSKFGSSYAVEMYVNSFDGFEGEGDMFSKFGMEIRDQVELQIARSRWRTVIGDVDNKINSNRPREGDLIFVPFSKSLFEITHVDHEKPFYQINNVPAYTMKCELFEYSGEEFDTGIVELDNVEDEGFLAVLQLNDTDGSAFIVGETVIQTMPSGIIISGEVRSYVDSTNVVSLSRMGGDSGGWNEFASGTLTGDSSGTIRTVITMSEQLNQINAQNSDFGGIDFLSFDSDNPFGDPRNN